MSGTSVPLEVTVVAFWSLNNQAWELCRRHHASRLLSSRQPRDPPHNIVVAFNNVGREKSVTGEGPEFGDRSRWG